MMELSKKTLMNVSFDRNLFHKELLKAIKWMQNSEDLKYILSKVERKVDLWTSSPNLYDKICHNL
jgi:hypothetical protein